MSLASSHRPPYERERGVQSTMSSGGFKRMGKQAASISIASQVSVLLRLVRESSIMGCVSSKSFRRGPAKDTGYSRMSRNLSSPPNQTMGHEDFADYDSHETFVSNLNSKLESAAYKNGIVDMNGNSKNCKFSPSDTEFESFTFTSSLDVGCRTISGGAEPPVEDTKRECTSTFVYGFPDDAERGKKREKHLMRDYLNIPIVNDSKFSKNRRLDEERNALLMDDTVSYACREWMLEKNKNNISVNEQTITECAKFGDEREIRFSNPSNPIQQQGCTEIIDMSELMEGLDDISQTFPSRVPSKLCILETDISFNALAGSSNYASGDLGSPVWRKYYMQENGLTRNMLSSATGSPFNESPRRALSHSSFLDADDTRSVSSTEVPDANAIGLKILLSPPNSSFHPSPVNRVPSVVSSHDGNSCSPCMPNATSNRYSAYLVGASDSKSPYRSRRPSSECIGYECVGSDLKDSNRSPNMTRCSSRRLSTESMSVPGSPLFNPSLMATFEEALRTSMTGTEDWLRFDVNETAAISSSSAKTWGFLDAFKGIENRPPEETADKPSLPLSYELEAKTKSNLLSYDMRCPPRGEGKVVLYFTSLRGVRKTFEDCCSLRLILRGLGIQVDERDVWMHSLFRIELNDLLKGLFVGAPRVPQLFIKGRYIGGADEVKQLHEEGILVRLMDGLDMGLIHRVCNGCGDARFIPCFSCSGSRKVLDVNYTVTQCLDCNENGLMMCPMCFT